MAERAAAYLCSSRMTWEWHINIHNSALLKVDLASNLIRSINDYRHTGYYYQLTIRQVRILPMQTAPSDIFYGYTNVGCPNLKEATKRMELSSRGKHLIKRSLSENGPTSSSVQFTKSPGLPAPPNHSKILGRIIRMLSWIWYHRGISIHSWETHSIDINTHRAVRFFSIRWRLHRVHPRNPLTSLWLKWGKALKTMPTNLSHWACIEHPNASQYHSAFLPASHLYHFGHLSGT